MTGDGSPTEELRAMETSLLVVPIKNVEEKES